MTLRTLSRHLRFLPVLVFSVLLCACVLRAKEDDRPVVDAASVKDKAIANATLPTLWVVGDSTARSNAPMRGWGDEIAAFFDTTRINVVNRAIGGRSSRTYLGEGRWTKVLAEMKAGDFAIVQFGHNDVGAIDARGKFRGSLKGIGEETESVEKADKSVEVVHTYGWYLRRMVSEAKAKGVHVILATPVPHKNWENDFADHRKWMQAIAAEQGVPCIDVTAITGAAYAALGKETVATLFQDERTHTNPAGAALNASSVVAGLRGLDAYPICGYLSAKGAAVAPGCAVK